MSDQPNSASRARVLALAAPSCLARHGMPASASDLARHRSLGFLHPLFRDL